MKYLLVYHQFLQEAEGGNKLASELEAAFKKYLPYTVNNKQGAMASTHVDKRNLPVVRIDSKDKPTSVWLKVDETDSEISIKVKTIVNAKGNDLKGYGTILFDEAVRLLEQTAKSIGKTPIVYIDDDQSHGYWKHVEPKYKTEFRYT